jgi:hypothetical protein
MPENSDPFGIIAGNGVYPFEMARAARAAGETRLVAAAFEGETNPALAREVDQLEWLRVGQMSKLLKYLNGQGVKRAVMAGQIAPSNLFNLRPDFKALTMLARLPERNAESLFGAIAAELSAVGTELLPATTYMEHAIPGPGYHCGKPLKARQWDDVRFGYRIAKECGRLDIGQTIVVRNGTVLAVEAFEGTNEAIKRGGRLGKKGAVVVKVSKPEQDMRFDVPVMGMLTLRAAREAGISILALEAGRTLLLERRDFEEQVNACGLSVVTVE